MQITEHLRKEIAASLPKLGVEDASAIAKLCLCSFDTVYREWRKIHGRCPGKSMADNAVVVSLSELAASRKAEAEKLSKRLKKSMKQLSASQPK